MLDTNNPPGKAGRGQQVHDDPTTSVSPVTVHHQHHRDHANHKTHAVTDPNMMAQTHQAPLAEAYSVADGADARNRGAQAGHVAAHNAGHDQKAGTKVAKPDPEELKRIVAEEAESSKRLPTYKGLERWQLLDKMGDGAFSNVYKARDVDGIIGEVAIKVVRKFEMNSSQVSCIKSS